LDGELTEFVRPPDAHARDARSTPISARPAARHLYQGRFKAFAVQTDEHFYTLVRYAPARARCEERLVARTENWRWSNL
jgi:hypothetical protein